MGFPGVFYIIRSRLIISQAAANARMTSLCAAVPQSRFTLLIYLISVPKGYLCSQDQACLFLSSRSFSFLEFQNTIAHLGFINLKIFHPSDRGSECLVFFPFLCSMCPKAPCTCFQSSPFFLSGYLFVPQ